MTTYNETRDEADAGLPPNRLTRPGIALITAAIDWAHHCRAVDNAANDGEWEDATQSRRVATGRLRTTVLEYERTEAQVTTSVLGPHTSSA